MAKHTFNYHFTLVGGGRTPLTNLTIHAPTRRKASEKAWEKVGRQLDIYSHLESVVTLDFHCPIHDE